MSAEAKHFRLGLFVLGAAVLTAGATIVLGAGALFRTKVRVETTLDESVIGLDVGSPVRYRGVLVGEVDSISFVNTVYQVDDNRIRVVIAMYPDKVRAAATADGLPESLIRRLTEMGLRIRLASQGLTGGLYLELDYVDPKENPVVAVPWTPEHPHLPSIKSTGSRLMEDAQEVLRKVAKVPFQEIGDRVAATLENLEKLVRKIDPAVESIQGLAGETSGLVKDARKLLNESFSKDFQAVMTDIRTLLRDEVTPVLKSARASADRFPGTLERVDAALDRVSATLRKTDRLLSEREGSLEDSLDNIRAVTQDLRDVSSTLKRYPASALFGEAPPRPKSEGK